MEDSGRQGGHKIAGIGIIPWSVGGDWKLWPEEVETWWQRGAIRKHAHCGGFMACTGRMTCAGFVVCGGAAACRSAAALPPLGRSEGPSGAAQSSVLGRRKPESSGLV